MHLFTTSHSAPLRIINISDEVCGQYQKTPCIFSTFFKKSCRLRDKVEKIFTARKVTDDKMTHVLYMIDT